MFTCLYCNERDRLGYWSSWCQPCSQLRRMLLIYSPDKCCNILKRTLTRDENQISFKIQQEVKSIVNKQIEDTDASHTESPTTRSKKK